MAIQSRLRVALLTLVALYGLFAFASLAAADSAELEAEAPAADSEELEAKALAAPQDPGKPGEHHRHLASLIGKWDYTMQIWNSPDTEPLEMVGTSEARWILGRRFVETSYQGNIQGRAFRARSIDGYDNNKEKYTNIWQDNLGTYTVVAEGDCSEDGKVRTMSYQFNDTTSGLTLINENVTTVIDENTNQSESFIKSATGVSFKNMELTTTPPAERHASKSLTLQMNSMEARRCR